MELPSLYTDREVCDRRALLLAKRVLETNPKHARESLTVSVSIQTRRGRAIMGAVKVKVKVKVCDPPCKRDDGGTPEGQPEQSRPRFVTAGDRGYA